MIGVALSLRTTKKASPKNLGASNATLLIVVRKRAGSWKVRSEIALVLVSIDFMRMLKEELLSFLKMAPTFVSIGDARKGCTEAVAYGRKAVKASSVMIEILPSAGT